jgi:hypothetical protein
MSANAPLGEVVTVGPTDKAAAPGPKAALDDEWPEADWTTSSFALLSGCQVKDYTARIPDQVFERLFKD